jgi:AcrR family transcriptional regulator
MKSDSADARTSLLRSAIGAFARKGYAGTSINDILAATNLSRPMLYYYFNSKAGVFQAILDYAYDESFRLMTEAKDPALDAPEQLTALATACFAFAETNKDITRLLFSTMFAHPQEMPLAAINSARRKRNFDLFLEVIRTGQQKGDLTRDMDPLDLTHGIFGLISHHIRSRLLLGKPVLNRDAARRVVDLFLHGALPRP